MKTVTTQKEIQWINIRVFDDQMQHQKTPNRRLSLGDVLNQIHNTVTVAVLVVVPGDQLDESVTQLDAGLGIEHTTGGAADEIGRDNLRAKEK